MYPRVLEKNLSTILRWGIFLLLPLPLYISSSMLFPFITGRNFGFRILVEILAVAWVGLLALSRDYRPRLSPLVKSVVLLLFIATIADLLGANPYRSFWSNYERMEGLIGLIHMVLFFLMLPAAFRTFNQWRAFFYGSSIVSLLVAAVAISQKFGLTQSYQGGVRVDGTIGNPAYLASYLMFNVFFLLFFIWRENRNWMRWMAAAAILIELWVIYLTATRGVILAMLAVAGLLALAFAFKRAVDRREVVLKKSALSVLLLGVVVIGTFFAFRNTQFVRSNPVLGRFASISFEERTVQSRFLIWNIAWQGVKERPILGWGQENFYFVFNKYFNPQLWANEPWFDRSHNVFFDWMIHAGILGLLAYLAVLFFGARNIWLAYRSGVLAFYEASIMAGLLLAYFLQNLFVFDNFQSYFLLFSILAFTDFLARPALVEKREDISLERVQPSLVALSVAGAVAVLVLYFVNVRPILASQYIIQGLQTAGRQGMPNEVLAQFRKAIDMKTLGTGEAMEQLATLSRSLVGRQNQANSDDIRAFLEYTTGELKKLSSGDKADAKHLLFLASVYNAAPGLVSDYPREPLQALERAQAIAPKKQHVYFELGTTYLSVQQFDQAIASMEKAIELDPSFPNAHLNLALAHFAAGNKEGAEKALRGFRELVPHPDVQSLLRITQGYFRMGDFASIRPILEEIIRLEPKNADYYAQYAVVLGELGEKTAARQAAEKAIELNPTIRVDAEAFIKALEEE